MADSLRTRVADATPLLVLGAGLLALFAGVQNWWVIFVVGWAVVTPLVHTLVGDGDEERSPVPSSDDRAGGEAATDESAPGDTQDALDTLRERYARGELSDREFERKLEDLLATETPEDARRRVGGDEGGDDAAASRDREPEYER